MQLALGYLKSIAAPQHCKFQQFQHGSLHVFPHLIHQMCGTQGFCDGKECKTASQFQWIYAALCISLLGGYELISPFPTDLSSRSQRALKQNYL